MKLIGSTTSPYVRRIRLLLAATGQAYEFVDLNIYGEDRDELRKQNPALKIPVLHDGDDVIYDSRVIFRYLAAKLGLPALSWKEENQLTVIDAVNDSMVTLLLSQRSGLDTNEDRLLFNLQKERVTLSLQALEGLVQDGLFKQWDYRAICLFTALDWGLFRDTLVLEDTPALVSWLSEQQERPDVIPTDPRLV
ncbi:glutathione S-transferase family protein [Marinobacterium lutimaris]|uniref:Glutathione S-transferase n=1 Tax=Marinobacterium lutimaris TaxID=568106 RepID=A0A1H5TZC2_9GAMM|nr:glutathione S-transferase family protein [Marinobacterium lutimaris]SEF68212.1 glutathione S-transferase [Marinobacterium lutimaris]